LCQEFNSEMRLQQNEVQFLNNERWIHLMDTFV
jgi:hypothetical protein